MDHLVIGHGRGKKLPGCLQRLLPGVVHTALGIGNMLLLEHASCLCHKGQLLEVKTGVLPFHLYAQFTIQRP